jgi:15-cis-phytoene synthase
VTGTDLDPDRILALSYVAATRRPAVSALWRLDRALGQVLAGGREPMISRIKLAWWRESLEKLDCDVAPGEPLLGDLAATVLPAGISGAELAEMEPAWSLLVEADRLGPEELRSYAQGRGGLLFLYSARLLGAADLRQAESAGRRWALVDLARHSAEPDEADAAIAEAAAEPVLRVPSRLRPLGMLAALAIRDAEPTRPRWEPQGSPGRMLRMLRHRFTGR